MDSLSSSTAICSFQTVKENHFIWKETFDIDNVYCVLVLSVSLSRSKKGCGRLLNYAPVPVLSLLVPVFFPGCLCLVPGCACFVPGCTSFVPLFCGTRWFSCCPLRPSLTIVEVGAKLQIPEIREDWYWSTWLQWLKKCDICLQKIQDHRDLQVLMKIIININMKKNQWRRWRPPAW